MAPNHKENADSGNQRKLEQAEPGQSKTRLKDKWEIIKRKLNQRKFDEFLGNGLLKPFLETFCTPENEEKSRKILKELVLSFLWKLELAGLLRVFPFRECVQFDSNAQMVNTLQINNCEYFQLDQICQLLTFLEKHLQSKDNDSLNQIKELIKEPKTDFIEWETRRYKNPQFNFNSESLLESRDQLVQKFMKLSLENHFKQVPRNLERCTNLAKSWAADNRSRFWGSAKYDFNGKRISIEIAQQNGNHELIREFSQFLRVGFGLASKTVSLGTGKIPENA